VYGDSKKIYVFGENQDDCYDLEKMTEKKLSREFVKKFADVNASCSKTAFFDGKFFFLKKDSFQISDIFKRRTSKFELTTEDDIQVINTFQNEKSISVLISHNKKFVILQYFRSDLTDEHSNFTPLQTQGEMTDVPPSTPFRNPVRPTVLKTTDENKVPSFLDQIKQGVILKRTEVAKKVIVSSFHSDLNYLRVALAKKFENYRNKDSIDSSIDEDLFNSFKDQSKELSMNSYFRTAFARKFENINNKDSIDDPVEEEEFE